MPRSIFMMMGLKYTLLVCVADANDLFKDIRWSLKAYASYARCLTRSVMLVNPSVWIWPISFAPRESLVRSSSKEASSDYLAMIVAMISIT